MKDNNVQLAWALVDGHLAHICEFRGIPVGSRQSATCHACGAGLIMKIGQRRAPHYAHKPGAHCALTNPETALHYNSKHSLANALRGAAALSVVTTCSYHSRSTRCREELASGAAEEWTEVHVEPAMDSVRPDILLLKDGTPVLAIEVRATHAVPEAKAAWLSEHALPWIEVSAGRACDAWRPGSPLRVIRNETREAARFCDTHFAIIEESNSPGQSDNPVPAPRRRRATRVSDPYLVDHGDRWKFRVVDCYKADGLRERMLFWVYTRETGTEVRLRLVDDKTSAVLAELPLTQEAEQVLRKLYTRLAERLGRPCQQFSSPLRWQDAAEFPDNPVAIYKKDFMPVVYRRERNGTWVKSSDV